ncbi:hypothetical protein D3C72_1798560 [compost metagenome]
MLVDDLIDAGRIAGLDRAVGLQDVEGLVGGGQHELVGRTVGVRLGLRRRGGRHPEQAREDQSLQQ